MWPDAARLKGVSDEREGIKAAAASPVFWTVGVEEMPAGVCGGTWPEAMVMECNYCARVAVGRLESCPLHPSERETLMMHSSDQIQAVLHDSFIAVIHNGFR